MTKKQNSVFPQLKKVLDSVENSPYSNFYKNKYQQAGVNLKKVNSLEDFLNLPYLTKNEMIKVGPFDRLYIDPKDTDGIVVTSGTTSGGNSPYVSFKSKMSPALKQLQFIKTDDFKIQKMMVMRKVLGRSINSRVRGFLLFFGDLNNLEASAKVAAQVKIDALFITSTILYFFLPYLKKEYDPKNIKYIRLGGEYTSEKRLNYLKKHFPNAYFEMTYGSSETQRIGYRCEHLDKMAPRFFHPISDFFYESRDPEEDNELIVTHLDAEGQAFPLIRYRTGDSVKLETIDCPCGNNQRLEVLGRIGYDLFKIQGTSIYVDYVYKALEPFAKYLASPEWQLHIYEETQGNKLLPKLKLQLMVKKDQPVSLKQKLETGISQNLYLSARSTLADLVNKNAFLPLEVEFVSEFPVNLKKKHIISHLA